MSPLTEEQTNSFLVKIGEIFDVPLFTKTDTNHLLTLAKRSVQWETRIKQQLTKAGLNLSMDQIALLPCNPATNNSMVSVQTLAPLFALYNLDVSKENLTSLLGKITESTSAMMQLSKGCINYTAPFPRDFYTLDQVNSMRPEYLVGTWFNRQEKSFKVNMEFDWVTRMDSTGFHMPAHPMDLLFFSSTGDHIWDIVSEVHIHRSAMMEFTRPRDGYLEAVTGNRGPQIAPDSPLNFIERMTKVTGARTLVLLKSGAGGWATFDPVRNSDVTPAAARLLFKFSDPLYCARSDGKVVLKLKSLSQRATMNDMSTFPSTRVLVTDQNKFPSCIP